MHRIVEVRRLDHVVLLVAAQAMLRTESGADLHVAACGQRIQRMRQIFRDRSRMREQRHALALERCAQSRFGDESIDTETSWLHGRRKLIAQNRPRDGSPAFRADAPSAQYDLLPLVSSINADKPRRHEASRGKPDKRSKFQRGLQSEASGFDCTSIEGAPISAATHIPLR